MQPINKSETVPADRHFVLAASRNSNGTVTVSNSFYLDPVRAMQGHTLSCLVNHSTFTRPILLDYTLNIYYVPEVSVKKSSENWHVGMDNAELICQENGNPPANGFVWKRLERPLPNNSVTEGNKLLFRSSLSAEDSGTYICEVTNKIGSRTGQIDVKVIDTNVPSVNMLSMAFVAIGAVGLLLLLILVISIVAVNRYHKNKTEQMVFKLEEISTMSRQPSIRRCNSMSASVDARIQDGGGSQENVLEQEPMLQEALAMVTQQQLRNSSRDLPPVNGEGTLPLSAFGNHRYSLRSTTSETAHVPPAYQFGAFRHSMNSGLRYNGRERVLGPGSRTLPPPIPLSNHRDSTGEMTVTPEQVEILTSRNLTPSPSVPDSQTEDEDEVTDRQQSIHAAMGHFYSHNGTLRAKPTGNGIYIARREHCV
ncbi:nectin-4-like [Rhincodon typus]|uniref:nectin-4-like n=1 Tax=Rhincodon typus TaxID=259920 RepID=UPI00203047B4|nr:nectin-4-like [Rhincodon typus]